MAGNMESSHPETTSSRMEISAVSDQPQLNGLQFHGAPIAGSKLWSDRQSSKTLFLKSFAESRNLMADSASPKRQFVDEHYISRPELLNETRLHMDYAYRFDDVKDVKERENRNMHLIGN
jgi:hypothetical protein